MKRHEFFDMLIALKGELIRAAPELVLKTMCTYGMGIDISALRMEEDNKNNTHTLILSDDEFHWLYYFIYFKGVGHKEAHDILAKMK